MKKVFKKYGKPIARGGAGISTGLRKTRDKLRNKVECSSCDTKESRAKRKRTRKRWVRKSKPVMWLILHIWCWVDGIDSIYDTIICAVTLIKWFKSITKRNE